MNSTQNGNGPRHYKGIKLHSSITLMVFLSTFLLGLNANAAETITERNLLNSIKEFSHANMPLSFGKLWATEVDNDIPYDIWRSIKISGDRCNVNWTTLSFHDSYHKTIKYKEKSYLCGIVIFKVNVGDYSSLGCFYLSDSNGAIVNMRDNWSRELSNDIPVRAKESLEQLVERWL